MDKTKHGQQHKGWQDQEEGHLRSPYWKRIHHHWYFWVAMLLMLAAIVNYIMSEDLSLRPRSQPQQPRSSVNGK
jgi:hypothetical protein